MATPITMPKLGMTMQEGSVREWPLSLGSPVEKDQTVLVIESEKAEVEIPATAGGVFRHIYVQIDETVPCGTLLGAIARSVDEPFDAEEFRRAQGGGIAVGAAAATSAADSTERADATRAGRSASRKPVAPAARALARRHGLDPEVIPGSGPGGRVVKADVQAWVARRMGRIEVADGVCLQVPSQGEGVPVLLLPGFGFDVSSFRFQVDSLAENHRVLGVNPRGVGLSDAPETDAYTVATAAQDAARVIAQPVHVVGASLGAAVALELALEHPEAVRSLTLVTPFVEMRPRLRAVLAAWCAVARQGSPDTLALALLPWLFSPGTLADEHKRELTRRGLATAVADTPPSTLERSAQGLATWSGSRGEDLHRIHCPTLVVVAAEDLLAPDGEAVARAIPGAVTAIVADAGHAVAVEAAPDVNEALAAHLERV